MPKQQIVMLNGQQGQGQTIIKAGDKLIILPGQQQQQQPRPQYQQPMVPVQPMQPMMPMQPVRPVQPMQMQQPMMGGMPGFNQMNRWATPGMNYQTQPGFVRVDYSGGWNPNVHDNMLKSNIQQVFNMYDRNRNGQLDGNEFFYAYRDLCLRMGMAPPSSQQEVWNMAMQSDTNRDGMISPMELFMLFKRLQNINAGMQMQPGMQMHW